MTTSVKNRLNHGFTIIEVILTLSVASLLLLIALLGQGETTRRARFTDSVESLKAQMEAVRDSVNTTVIDESEGCNRSPVASTPDCIKYGKVINFNNESDQFSVQTIIANGPGANNTPINSETRVVNPRVINQDNPQVETTLWGLEPVVDGGNIPRIAFVRHAGTGKLETHILLAGQQVSSESSYQNPNTSYTLPLESPEGYRARMVFNEPANSIEVRFD